MDSPLATSWSRVATRWSRLVMLWLRVATVVSSHHVLVASRNRRGLESQSRGFDLSCYGCESQLRGFDRNLSLSCTRDDADASVHFVPRIQAHFRKLPIRFH
ncbi:hypothetical protein HanPSC8_Chr07g0291091 [Helianthus annuus]|nr:hypothetical protein HanPSC8_Chr07g0291091 [Helianthus annuus]